MPYVPVRGACIYYKDLGQGTVLILVPGLGGDSRAFNPLLPFLRKERLRIVAFDPRGLGRSQGNLDHFSMEDMVLDLVGLMDALSVREAFFLGTSLGALVLKDLARAWPGRVKGLVLCTPPPTTGPRARKWDERLQRLLNTKDPQEIMMSLLQDMVSQGYLERNRKFLQDLALHYQVDEQTRRVMIRQLEIWREQQEAWVLPEIPCLLLGGEEDRLVGLVELERISLSLPRSRLVILKGVGHHLVLEAPWWVAKEVAMFLAEASRNSEA